MEISYDRRNGFDRRHRFLNSLDRRMTPPPPFVTAAELDAALGTAGETGTPPQKDQTRDSAYWGACGDTSPIE